MSCVASDWESQTCWCKVGIRLQVPPCETQSRREPPATVKPSKQVCFSGRCCSLLQPQASGFGAGSAPRVSDLGPRCREGCSGPAWLAGQADLTSSACILSQPPPEA